MMWNWLISSLGVGATIVLYDGNPNYPDAGAMWKMAQDEKISIFGLSAAISIISGAKGFNPERRTIFPLFERFLKQALHSRRKGSSRSTEEVKQDLHFNSIAGGTDINGCFAIGSPIQPVYAGRASRARAWP